MPNTPPRLLFAALPALLPFNAHAQDTPDELPLMNVEQLEQLKAEAAEAEQVLVLDFWGTWCAPCIALFDPLHHELEAMGDVVRPVTVAWDFDGHADEIAFLDEHHALTDAYVVDEPAFDELHAAASQRVADGGNVAYPIVIVIAPDGTIAAEFHGGDGAIEASEVAAAVEDAMP